MKEEKQEYLEEENKKLIFDKISNINSEQIEMINLITINAKNIGQLDVSIPNVGITLNNKLVELSQEFKRHGISMFYSDYGIQFVGAAIINDLIDRLVISIKKLREYDKELGSIVKNKREQEQALQNISPIKKFFSKIRSFFVKENPIDLSLTEEEQKILDSSLQEYKDVDDQIWNYNLRDNIISSIVKQFTEQKFYDPQGLLNRDIIPDLKKLELGDLVPELQKTLEELNIIARNSMENDIDLENFEKENSDLQMEEPIVDTQKLGKETLDRQQDVETLDNIEKQIENENLNDKNQKKKDDENIENELYN